MASSFWSEEKYPVHFLCAFCGGPFARVLRSDDARQSPRAARVASRRAVHDAHLSLRLPARADEPLSPEELRGNTTDALDLGRDDGPPPGGPAARAAIDDRPTVRRAYDGRRAPEAAMRWTGVLRALIHRDAQVQPQGGLDQLHHDRDVYLTGRGRVRQDASWADAHASIHDDLEHAREDEHGLPRFTNDHRRFHLYQEPDRNDRKFRIASIPFHDECWDVMSHAVHGARAARGLPDADPADLIDLDALWTYLCDLIPTAMDGKFSDLTIDTLRGDVAADTITRLSSGCMGAPAYREAQRCGDGKRWLHEVGLHVRFPNPTARVDDRTDLGAVAGNQSGAHAAALGPL